MAMQVGGGGSDIKSDINVTPLVDVMLVLLIIVMLIAPLVQQGVNLTLPVARNTADHPESQDQTTVAVTLDKRLWINGQPVEEKDFHQRIEETLEGKKDRLILIKADQGAEYGAVMHAMDELRSVGIEDMALIMDRRKVVGGE